MIEGPRPEPPAPPAPPRPPADVGPPGSAVFSLERRPGAGLYLMAWLLSIGGIALAFIGIQAQAGLPRLLILAGLIALALGLAAGAGYQVLARQSRPDGAYCGPSPLLLFALVIVLVNLLGGALAVVTGGIDVESPQIFLAGLLIQVTAYIGLIWIFVVRTGALRWSDLVNGNRPAESSGAVAVGTGIGVMAPVTIVVLILGSIAALLLDATPPETLPVPDTPFSIAVGALAAIVLAPLGEELFFRGYALTAWWRDLGPRSALIRSAVFFALIHVFNVTASPGTVDLAIRQSAVVLVVLLPIGFVLGGLFIRRGLLASIAAHSTYNAIIFGLLLLSTALPPPPG